MTFSDISGHAEVKRMLCDITDSGRVSHSYIFSGKKGVGKHLTARAWANMLTGGSAADITEITNETFAESSKKTAAALSVDTVRAARTDMYLKPYMAEKRVFIIPNGEEMTQQAQNALLKVFEEPPEYCVIIIVTDNLDAMLQTIRSRAVTVRFGSLSENEIKEILEKKGYSPAPLICALADGSAGLAEELCQNGEKYDLLKTSITLLNSALKGKTKEKYELIAFMQKNRADCNNILNTFILFFEQSLLQLCEKNVTIPIEVNLGSRASYYITAAENCKKALKGNVNFNMAVSEFVHSLG